MHYWRAFLTDNRVEYDVADAKRVQRMEGFKRSTFHHSQETELRASEIDAVGLTLLSSVDSQIRHIAVELVRCVHALGNDTRELLLHEQLEVIQWLAHIKPAELGGKAHQSQDDKKLDQWLMYAMFACSCPSDIREGGDSEAIKELFHLIFPSLHAAAMALGHSYLEICEVMFSKLASVIDESPWRQKGNQNGRAKGPAKKHRFMALRLLTSCTEILLECSR
ncbi:hypothetical protein BC332_05786 [Capsicum chinense]|nr:hypothetical protein BC332_05786 [Capsicum chinense]